MRTRTHTHTQQYMSDLLSVNLGLWWSITMTRAGGVDDLKNIKKITLYCEYCLKEFEKIPFKIVENDNVLREIY